MTYSLLSLLKSSACRYQINLVQIKGKIEYQASLEIILKAIFFLSVETKHSNFTIDWD